MKTNEVYFVVSEDALSEYGDIWGSTKKEAEDLIKDCDDAERIVVIKGKRVSTAITKIVIVDE